MRNDMISTGSTEQDRVYMIRDNNPLTNKFISVPSDYGQLNCAAYIGGIIHGVLDSAGFPASVTAHTVDGEPLYALFGHLSAASTAQWTPGQHFARGTVLGWLGNASENCGWPPHVHFQLSRVRPETHDMPGVVDPAMRDTMLQRYPDPRMVLGPLY